MNTNIISPPLFAGRGFRVDYEDLSAHNIYSADGSTVVHIDDFTHGVSNAFFTVVDLSKP